AVDLAGYRAADGRPPIPRLVVVVDEFATLVDELPDGAAELVAVARRGRSLGLHLVLATQRPAGVVSSDIRANIGLRLCLRVSDASESADVIDSPLAARLSTDLPGRGYLRRAGGAVEILQTARVTGHSEDSRAGIRVRLAGAPPAAATGAVGATDLERLVRSAGQAAACLGT